MFEVQHRVGDGEQAVVRVLVSSFLNPKMPMYPGFWKHKGVAKTEIQPISQTKSGATIPDGPTDGADPHNMCRSIPPKRMNTLVARVMAASAPSGKVFGDKVYIHYRSLVFKIVSSVDIVYTTLILHDYSVFRAVRFLPPPPCLHFRHRLHVRSITQQAALVEFDK
ncbi:hypothetical protein EX30DRAFT_388877 [Ascodesmis nigricans]|uniref:Uncharacterized protein n=1 Tax=Ascodesmis nigricans TaxID=341454 RepID=A0A4S2MJD5_9PEZI|nr:hypothetical protein EX30DRAFT_388877 [Ascodesmis nigricans]